ncbi:VWA containing CoxE family protein, partial [Chloroflexota bacterium]
EIELKWRRSRKHAVKVLLLMDVGGSMDPFALMCSQLFSAAHSSTHFKDLRYYYFHNCIYDNVYQDIERREEVSTDHLLRVLEPDYKLLVVGDARMAPTELLEMYGAINYHERNETPGIVWFKRMAKHFTHRVWLNPDDPGIWNHPSVHMIGKLFPMFPFTLEGLGQGVKKLVVSK